LNRLVENVLFLIENRPNVVVNGVVANQEVNINLTRLTHSVNPVFGLLNSCWRPAELNEENCTGGILKSINADTASLEIKDNQIAVGIVLELLDSLFPLLFGHPAHDGH